MSHSDRLAKTPATFRRLTGLTLAAFDRLLGEVAAARGGPPCRPTTNSS